MGPQVVDNRVARRYVSRAGLRSLAIVVPVYLLPAIVVVAGHRSPVALAVLAVGIAVTGLFVGDALFRGGVRESPSGISNRRGFVEARWEWTEIDHFANNHNRVVVVLRDNRKHSLRGVAQGQVVKWQGGETRDIVGLLNARLDASRGARSGTRS